MVIASTYYYFQSLLLNAPCPPESIKLWTASNPYDLTDHQIPELRNNHRSSFNIELERRICPIEPRMRHTGTPTTHCLPRRLRNSLDHSVRRSRQPRR